jgi:hypothetical protein
MIVAWLTLPSDEEQIVNRACFQQCKEVIAAAVVMENLIYSADLTTLKRWVSATETCTKEKNENID